MKTYEQLAPYEQRVVDELDDLVNKSEKLESFFSTDVFDGLEEFDKFLLEQQALAMDLYISCLRARIRKFTSAPTE